MIDYATFDDVNNRRAGDVPKVSDNWDETIQKKIAEISRDLDRKVARVRGATGEFTIVAAATASSRDFTAPDGSPRLLPIDDCIAVASVAITATPGGSASALVAGTDYQVVWSRGVIVGLRRVVGWPPYPAVMTAGARWGLMAEISPDLREHTILEVIRSYLGDRSGNDDRIGMTPFGSVVTAKAYTSKVASFVADFAYGGASLR